MPPTHTSDTIQALYRTFVLPSLRQQPRVLPLPRTIRPFSSTPPRLAKTRAPETRAQKWNHEIDSEYIYLVDPRTSERSALQRLSPILSRINLDTHRLVQVDEQPDHKNSIPTEDAFGALEGVEKRAEGDPPVKYPVCKILGKKDMYQADKARKMAQKEAKKNSAAQNTLKTLELNWAIDGNDLGHRLTRLQEFLQEGRKVEVVLAAKKAGRKASIQECEAVLERIRGAVEDVPGAKEAKALEGKVGGFCTVLFQGKVGQAEGKSGGGKEKAEGKLGGGKKTKAEAAG